MWTCKTASSVHNFTRSAVLALLAVISRQAMQNRLEPLQGPCHYDMKVCTFLSTHGTMVHSRAEPELTISNPQTWGELVLGS